MADTGAAEARVPVHIEVALGANVTVRTSDAKQAVAKRLADVSEFQHGPMAVPDLAPNIQAVVVDLGPVPGPVSIWRADVHMHVFRLSEDGPVEEATEEDEDSTACQHWTLPAADFDGLWESLVFDSHIKQNLLDYAATAMLFADSKVDPRLISCNRIVLLHGPPGTGKTSLCKALSHKLAIRLSYRYASAALLEINAHSLFSKWFSESGKLVMKLFSYINELVEDEDTFVCVLIDEVESLSAARTAAVAGSEPSDAIRVVNALLTELDRLKRHENVLILTTSNITGAIDIAFVDRADIKQYIGLPSPSARYTILASCVNELGRRGLLTDGEALPEALSQADAQAPRSPTQARVMEAAKLAEGLSGRALRKLPFQAFASQLGGHKRSVPCLQYCEELCRAVQSEHNRRADVARASK